MSTIHFSRIAWNVIQITLRVRFFVIDGRWNDARLKTQQADGKFNRSTRGSRMSQHTFGTGNGHLPRILTKCMLDGERFHSIVENRSRAMGIDVVNVLRI